MKQFLLLFVILLAGCAGHGELKDHYDQEFYQVKNLLNEDSLQTQNPRFLVTGDTQRGWRINEKFLRGENWKSKWMALVPFYQLYLLGNGISGGLRFLTKRPEYHPTFRDHMRNTLYNRAKSNNNDFLLILGDLCASDGTRPLHWKYFIEENRNQTPLFNSVPIVTVPGNHDRTANPQGEANYKAVFNGPPFYTLEFKDAVLICLDSNYLVDQKNDIADTIQETLFSQYFVSDDTLKPSWLEQQLSRFADKRFKIVAMHHPPVSFGRHYSNWLRADYGNDLNEKRIRFIDRLLENNVQVVFTGHEHLYEHNIIKRDKTRPDLAGRELHIVISSSGGVPLRAEAGEQLILQREQDLATFGIEAENVRQLSDYHFTEVQVTSDSLLIETWLAPRSDGDEVSLLEALRFGN